VPRRTDTQPVGRTIVRYAWVLYWLGFSALAVRGGFSRGLVRHRELAPYPWVGVAWTSALLGVLTFTLHRILKLGSWQPSWFRWAASVGLALAFAAWEFEWTATDMPGYMYVPRFFATVTLLLLLASGTIGVAYIAFRRWRERSRKAA
jgi:hypothetical protein